MTETIQLTDLTTIEELELKIAPAMQLVFDAYPD